MDQPTITCIVEGYGDVSALPVLLRRLAAKQERYDLRIPTPIRCPRSKIIRPGDQIREDELSRAVELAARKLESTRSGAVLVLFDADESCPATLGPRLQESAQKARPDVTVRAVLANTEFESWFLPDLSTLAGRDVTACFPDPEAISNPKRHLKEHICAGFAYSETVDQPRFAASFNLDAAERCHSFRKFLHEVQIVFSHVFGET